MSNVREVKGGGGRVVGMIRKGNEGMKEMGEDWVEVGEVGEWVRGVVVWVGLELVGY